MSSMASRPEILRERLLRFGRLTSLSLKTIDDGLSSRCPHIPEQTVPNFHPNKKDLGTIHDH